MNQFSNISQKKAAKSGGFSLIELSIVIVIIGIIIMGIAATTTAYKKFARNEEAQTTISIAKDAIDNFYAQQKRYPCPADPALAPTDSNYGMENCALATVPGARTMTPANPVLVGTFPKYAMVIEKESNTRKPIALSEYLDPTKSRDDSFIDPWNHQLTYAVTTQLIGQTSGANIGKPKDDRTDRERGNISVVDENGDNTGGTKGNADYIILSHGKDGVGARNANSTITATCDTAYTLQHENCDNDDAKFMQGLMNNNETNKATYFDDYVTYTRVVDTDIWARRDGDDAIYNTNSGNIGINKPSGVTAGMKLDVGGTIHAENIISAATICDTSGNCFAPESIYNVSCPAGQVMKRIAINGTQFTAGTASSFGCEPVKLPTCNMNCPSYQVIQGFNSAGCPICTPPQ